MLTQLGIGAKKAERVLMISSSQQKNQALEEIAKALIENISYITENNAVDIKNACENGMSESMIDRLSLHYVVDFIDFRIINFAVFNGADSFVCVGAGLMVLSLILEMKQEIKKEKEEKAKALSEKDRYAYKDSYRPHFKHDPHINDTPMTVKQFCTMI